MCFIPYFKHLKFKTLSPIYIVYLVHQYNTTLLHDDEEIFRLKNKFYEMHDGNVMLL